MGAAQRVWQAACRCNWESTKQGEPCRGTHSEAFRDLRCPMHRCLHALTHGMTGHALREHQQGQGHALAECPCMLCPVQLVDIVGIQDRCDLYNIQAYTGAVYYQDLGCSVCMSRQV